jgi:hypothetical protein
MSITRRLRWGIAQIGAKPVGADMARLLAADSLPGNGWKVLDERSWKTGASGGNEPWAQRAREANLQTAWRSFEQESMQRWLWVQVIPLLSEADALAALEAAPSRFLANTRAKVKVTSSEDIEPLPLRGQVAGWAHQQVTSGPKGAGVSLYAAFVVGSTLSVIAASGMSTGWDWSQLQQVAQTQADLL